MLVLFTAFVLSGCMSRQDASSSSDSASNENIVNKEYARPDSITMAFTGDILFGTTYPDELGETCVPRNEGRNIFDACSHILKHVDIAAGNLEGVITDAKTAKTCHNPSLCFTFRMPLFTPDRLKEAGFDYMNLANNHSEDFSARGLDDCMKRLGDSGIAFGGIRHKAPYAIIESNGRKVAFTGFSTGTQTLSVNNYDELKSVMDTLRDKADLIVVCIHAGKEGAGAQHVPREMEMFHGWPRGDVYKFAHMAIDLGADVVWGHGPHLSRGMELYRDRLIMYSLGNFCTPYKMGIAGVNGEAPIAEITLNSDGSFRCGQIHSFVQLRGEGPRIDEHHTAAQTIRRLSQQDFPESTLKIGYDGELKK